MKIFFLFIVCVIYLQSVFAVPLTVEVLHSLKRAGTPVASPNGVVFTSRVWDPSGGVTINIEAFSEVEAYSLTSSPGKQDVSPTFSPDGLTVAFLSTRTSPMSVYTVPFVGSEDDVTLFVTLPVDIDNLLWVSAGDESYLLYTISVYPQCTTLDCTAKHDKDVESRGPNTWKLYDSLFVRHWDTWETGKVSHIFVQKVIQNSNDYSWSVSGAPRDLMPGLSINCPIPPFGGMEQIDVSPDGLEIAFTGEVVNRSTAWSTSWRTFVVPMDGSKPPTSIADSILARTQNPKYSPDGKYLAFLSMNRPGYESDKLHINRYDRQTRMINTVTNTIDISFSGLEWDKDSKWVLADADYFNRHLLFAVDMINLEPKEPPKAIITEGSVSGISREGLTDTFYISSNSMTSPDDLWKFNFTNGQIKGLTQITFLNKILLNGIELQTPEEFHFTGSNYDEVYGWILKPYGWTDSSKMWPVVNLIHGGPQGSWNDDWSYRWNPQLWTGHGYGVMLINFHGSTGFSQNFTDAINHHWGDIPYWDIMNGTMVALKNNPWMNPNAVGACGASYGGYMVNWIQGQTDLFKVLVTHDGIFDTFLGYYATEELWFPAWEFDGVPWENPTLYNMWNPSRFVSNWKTPHLVIHGDHDYRLPLSHGLSVFNALQRKGIPSEFLYMTMENHWVLKPENSIMWYHTVLDWLDKWIGPKASQ